MTYIIYADVMFLWNTLINLTLLTLSSKIMGKSIRLKRLISCSLLISLSTILIYIVTFRQNTFIYHTLYATTYFFMIITYFRINSFKEFVHKLASVFIAMLILDGCINLICINHIDKLKNIVVILLLLFFMIAYICTYNNKKKTIEQNLLDVTLYFNSKKINLTGYMDTGNMLTEPCTNLPVIIVDYRVTKKMFDDNFYNLVLSYHNTGCFDYSAANKYCGTNFYPVPFQTISTNYALMPAFKITALTYNFSNKSYEKFLCGISRYKFKNTNNYQVLLNESLKPIREENSND